MLQAMVLSDESLPSWSISPTLAQEEFNGPRCVEVTGIDDPNTTWTEPGVVDKTVSPNMLRIQQTPSPSTSCESIRTSYLAGDPNIHPALAVVNPVPSQVCRQEGRSMRTRKLLPDTRSQRNYHSSRRTSSPLSDSPSPTQARKLTRLRPKPRHAQERPLSPNSPPPEAQTQVQLDLADRTIKDEFLIRQKQRGVTYKEIRRMGGFTEAESTLRGRYRTLTKVREARVRKPEWAEKDLRLLEKAVRTLSALQSQAQHQGTTLSPPTTCPAPTDTPPLSGDINPSKVPWKKVAEYIIGHGGSYHFGNSTCRKRWDELVREQGM
ncbi:hypothetical protein N0V88_001545 [Collariella sp. IMI 366227]|nr:hypothetical protein N0V88_001545 [Collariella sp. IMI 366227]